MKKFTFNFNRFIQSTYRKLFLITMAIILSGCSSLPCTTACGKSDIKIANFIVTSIDKNKIPFIRINFTFESNVDLDESQKAYDAIGVSLAENNTFLSSREGRVSANINLLSDKKYHQDRFKDVIIPNILINGKYQYTGTLVLSNKETKNRLKKLILEDGGVNLHIMMSNGITANHFSGSFMKLSLEQLSIE
jgi:hypothetical protein